MDGIFIVKESDTRDVVSRAMRVGSTSINKEVFDIDVLKQDLMGLNIDEQSIDNAIIKIYKIVGAIRDLNINEINSDLLREITNNVLSGMGICSKLKEKSLKISIKDYNDIASSDKADNSNFLTITPEMISFQLCEKLNKQLVCETPYLFDEDVRKAHVKGAIYCLSGKNYIWISKYGHITISELCNKLNWNNAQKTVTHLILDVSNENLFIDGGKIEKIMKVNKKYSYIRSIKLRSGNKIISTNDHNFILSSGKIQKAKDIVVGDKLLEVKEFYNTKEIINNICLLDFVEFQEKVFLHADRKLSHDIKKIFNINVQDTTSHGNRHFRMSLYKYKKLGIYDIYKFGKIKSVSMMGNSSSSKIFIKNSDDLLHLIGIYISDGCVSHSNKGSYQVCFAASIKEHRNIIIKEIKNIFGNKISIYEDDNGVRICDFLVYCFFKGIGAGTSAINKCLPVMFNGYENKILSGVFAGDGCVSIGKKQCQIFYTSISKRLIKDICRILSKNNISYRVDLIKNDYIYVITVTHIDNLKKFSENIGFLYNIKQEKLNQYINNYNRKYYIKPVDRNVVIENKVCKNNDDIFDIQTSFGKIPVSNILVKNCHDIGQPNRLYCHAMSLAYIGKYGIDLPTVVTKSAPAKYANVLLNHLKTYLVTLQSYFSGAIGIPYFNIFFAPYTIDLSDDSLKQICQELVFGLAQTAFARGQQTIFLDINLNSYVPDYLIDVDAICPGGKTLYDEKLKRNLRYGDFEKEIRRIAIVLMDAYKKGDRDGNVFPFPKIVLHVDKKALEDQESRKVIYKGAELSSHNGSTYFVFDRGNKASVAMCCRLSFGGDDIDEKMMQSPETIRFTAAQNVSINIPRIAFIAKNKYVKNHQKTLISYIYEEIDQVMGIAIKAHLNKQKKCIKLLENGGLRDLNKSLDGSPYININNLTWLIGLIGLNNAVQYLTGKTMDQDEEAVKIGLNIVVYMNEKCKEFSQKHNMKFVLEETPGETACSVLAQKDFSYLSWRYKDIDSVMRGDHDFGLYYESGVHLEEGNSSLLDRIRVQSMFSDFIPAGSIIHMWLGDNKPTPQSVMAIVEKIFNKTKAREITLTPDIAVCTNGHINLWKTSGKCAVCGSDIDYYISRVVGYFSRVDKWIKAKQIEFKNRRREKI